MADFQIDLELITKQFDASLSKTVSATNKFASSVDKNFDKVNSSIKGASSAMNSFVGNLGADAVGFAARGISNIVTGFANFTQAAVLAAVDAEETSSKFEAVFSTIGDSSESMAKDLQKNFGLGVNESKELLSATGDLLTGFGFAQEGALALSGDVQKVAVDLASFTNFSGGAKGASEAITKALLGERESLKSLGVSINEKAVQDQVAINNSKGLTFETEKQAKAQATLDLIMKQSVNAIGDYAKTSGGAANQLKLFNKRVEDFTIAFGQNFLPILEPVIQMLNEFISTLDMESINTFVKQGIVALVNGFETIVTAVNPVVSALSNMGSVFNIIQNGFTSGLATIGGAFTSFADGFISIIRDMISQLPSSIVPDSWISGLDLASEALAETTATMVEQVAVDANDMANSMNNIMNPENIIPEEAIETILAKTAIIKDGVIKARTDIDTDDVKRKKLAAALEKKEDAVAKKRIEDLNKEKLKQSEFEQELFGKQTTFEELGGKERAANLKSTLGVMATLSTSGNKELAAIGKAAAISTATIDGIAAVQKALASAPPPFNFALAATVGVATAANVAKIAGVGNFENGGIIPGASFSGDKLSANVNSGEMVLNRAQQTNLFNQANGGGNSNLAGAIASLGDRIASMEIVLVADDNEIARSTSRGVESGIVIGRS